jgi:hypothetical protein
MNNQVMVNLELLERLAAAPMGLSNKKAHWEACHDLRKLLAKTAHIPAAGERMEVAQAVAWMITATQEATTYPVVAMDWDDEGELVESLMTVAQHTRIVSDLQPHAMAVPDGLYEKIERHAMRASACAGTSKVVSLSALHRMLAAAPAPGDSQ